jgi:hypothetical protein
LPTCPTDLHRYTAAARVEGLSSVGGSSFRY